ncbi:MAG TPA: metallophosphoesterase family protein [Aquihabitans sp.]|jgi:calcineurin-like phosphoesterase family protein|nr:metallophosphoesterase family protein [Aquihabitans sp.]
MTTWFTADLHLGHRNIIRYCDRPFADVEEMDRALVDRWNEVVGDDDEVWVLGDVALGTIAESLPKVARLRGRKVLLAGNHDRCWEGNGRKAAPWVDRYLDAGFAEVRQGVETMEVAGHGALLCHFPYEGDSQDLDRHVSDRPVDRGQVLLHGHVHERWRVRDRMINVGVDVHDFRPVSEHRVAELIAGISPRPASSSRR